MRTLYIRWMLPIVAFLMLTIALLLGEVISANAAAVQQTSPTHTTTAPTPAPRQIVPNAWYGS